MPRPARTRPTGELTLSDRLSHLSLAQACRLLGSRGAELARAGGAREIDLDAQARLAPDRFSLELGDARVEIALAGERRLALGWRCSACGDP